MTDPAGEGLRRGAVRGGIALAGGQVLKGGIQFASLVVVARLLTPQDFGVVAMATVVVGFSTVLSDFGLSMAIMKERELAARVRDQIFYINVALALVIALMMWMSAGLIADFYDEDRLVGIVHWLALSAFMTSLAPQFRAELAHTLRFTTLALLDPASQAVGLAVAIAAALSGAGYWAVVGQQMAAAASLLISLALASGYRPRSRPKLGGIGTHFNLGLATLGAQATNYAAVSSAPAAAGKLLGSAAAGIYSRSYQLASIPLVQLAAPLTRVAVPVLSHTRDDEELISAVQRMQLILAFTLLPILMVLGIGGEPLARVLFGNPWAEVGSLTEILAIGGIFQVFGYVFFWIFIRKGRLGVLWACELVVWVTAVPLFFVFGSRGAEWIAGVYSSGLLGNWLLVGTWGVSRIGLSVRAIMLPSLRRLLWVAAIGVGAVATREALHGANQSSVTILLGSLLVGLVLACLLCLDPAFRAEMRSVSEIVRRDVFAR